MMTVAAKETQVNVGTYGGQSMTGRLRRVMVRQPAEPATPTDWQRFGYLHPIDVAESLREHADLVATLQAEVEEVVVAPAESPGNLDAIFAYDPSLTTSAGAILLRMGKPERVIESSFHRATYDALGLPVLGEIQAPGTVEGGDTLWLDESTLAIGRGYRTNEAGIAQMREILGRIGVNVLAYDLPWFHGEGECLHLMSMVSPIGPKLAVVYRPQMAVAFVQELESRGWQFIDCPDEEYESMGTNVLALAPLRVLALEGNAVTRTRMEAAGCIVLTYKGDEISRNRFGGPTCLTRPLLRDPEPGA